MRKLIVDTKAEHKLRIAMNIAKEYEIMWFGEILQNRKGNFILKDVYFPPQINKEVHVETHDEKYPTWQFETFIKTKKYKRIKLHGHTHPYFNTNPSSIDDKHIKTMLNETNDYFIQIILSNSYQPYCALHTKEDETEKIKIVWNYAHKIRKIIKGVMHIEHK